MKTIIFIGVNKTGSSREMVKAAVELGYYTVVFTDRKKQIKQRKEYPDVHQLTLVDTTNVEKVRDKIKSLQNKGHDIIAITSCIDPLVHTASILAEEFCTNYLSSEAIFIMESKKETREFFAKEDFTPAYLIIKKNECLPLKKSHVETLKFPAVVKSAKSTGSKDVLYTEKEEHLQENLLIFRENNPDDVIIIEEYVHGDQYLVEVLVRNNHILTSAVVEQEITKGERFIITGYGVLAEVDPNIEKELEKIIKTIVSSLNVKNGAFHLEVRLTNNGWKLIEINPRISGGAMNKMIEAAFGYSLAKETLKMTLGKRPSLKKKTNKFVFTEHIIIDKKGTLEKVTGKNKALQTPGVIEVYVKPRKGTLLTPPLSMGHRYAYVMATGDTMKEAKQAAKSAAKEITFHVREEE